MPLHKTQRNHQSVNAAECDRLPFSAMQPEFYIVSSYLMAIELIFLTYGSPNLLLNTSQTTVSRKLWPSDSCDYGERGPSRKRHEQAPASYAGNDDQCRQNRFDMHFKGVEKIPEKVQDQYDGDREASRDYYYERRAYNK
jgi:hypothetical protein